MSDVNDNVNVAEVAEAPEANTVETDTTQPQSQEVKQTADVPNPIQQKQDRMIPYNRFAEVNKGLREAQRRLAEFEQKSKLSQYTEDDMGAIMSHPYVQELLIKQAKSELTDYAKGLLEDHPEIPEQVKKAITTNVRGFVKENTSDVESAKLDIQEYIESLIDSVQPQVQPKVFPVASTKPQETASNARPIDVQKILEQPIDEWSEEDAKIVEQYKKSMPKR